MMKDDILNRFREVSDLLDEAMLISTILAYARRGRATRTMVEQAILLVDRHIDCAVRTNDAAMKENAEQLKQGLEEALTLGLEILKAPPPIGPEVELVEGPLAAALLRAGHTIRRQRRCANGVIDIYDVTADELIECKATGTAGALAEAGSQLQRYRKSFPGAAMVIAVPFVSADAEWLSHLLRQQGISIIEVGPR